LIADIAVIARHRRHRKSELEKFSVGVTREVTSAAEAGPSFAFTAGINACSTPWEKINAGVGQRRATFIRPAKRDWCFEPSNPLVSFTLVGIWPTDDGDDARSRRCRRSSLRAMSAILYCPNSGAGSTKTQILQQGLCRQPGII